MSIRRKTLFVANGTATGQIGGAIAKFARDGQPILLQAVGPNAVNQAIKGLAVAQTYLEQTGDQIYLTVSPRFTMVSLDGEKRTGLQLLIHPLPFDPDLRIPHRILDQICDLDPE